MGVTAVAVLLLLLGISALSWQVLEELARDSGRGAMEPMAVSAVGYGRVDGRPVRFRVVSPFTDFDAGFGHCVTRAFCSIGRVQRPWRRRSIPRNVWLNLRLARRGINGRIGVDEARYRDS